MPQQYDVFLSHNSNDKRFVEQLAKRLRQETNLEPFLDKWHLIPGEPWQEALEDALQQSKTVAVFVGPHDISPWHNEELRVALDTRARTEEFRVIPVLLPDATMPERGKLPSFLSRLTWVDFRAGMDDEEAFRRLICGIRGEMPGEGAEDIQLTSDEPPYKGLEKFQPEDAPWFFGRASETQQLVECVRKDDFLAVLGASGSGKSSVVLAGLVPAIEKGEISGSQDWPVVICTPTENPLDALALKLAPHIPDIGPAALTKDFEASERGLYLNLRHALQDAPTDRRFVLVIDQFEEAFTLCKDDTTRQQFFDNLLYASGVGQDTLKIILTMRADFMGKCAAYSELADRLASYQFIVTPMLESQLVEAIELPAKHSGLVLEPGLTEHILADVSNEPGCLPLLEHALFELWRRREGNQLTYQAYRDIDGVTGALALTADRAYDAFEPDEQKHIERIFLALVQPGEGTEDTSRPANFTDFAGGVEEKETLWELSQVLANHRLITTNQEADTAILQIAHEALLQNWPRLQTWIEEVALRRLL